MPEISSRAAAMPASPIRKLVPYAEAAKARGTHVYHLNIGQPDIETPRAFFEAIEQADIKVLEYAHSAGHASYRNKLVGYYEGFGVQGLQAKHILVTTGGSEALRFAFGACLETGDEVIVPEPFYANYLSFAMESGVVMRPITTYVEEGFALPDTAAFEALVNERTRAILLCNPSNPTGKLYDRQALEQLAAICKEHDLFLLADEVYKEFAYDGKQFHSTLTLPGMEQNVIVCDSVSKRYSGCGARIGSMVTKNEEVLEAALKYAQARLSPPTLGQIGAEALVDLPQSYFEGIRNEYVSRRDTVLVALEQMPDVLCPKVSGAFYVMPSLPIDDADRFCQWLLEEFSHEGATVMLAPGTGFYSTPGLGKQEVRIAYVLDEAELSQAMMCLAKALEAYPGRTPRVQAAAKAHS